MNKKISRRSFLKGVAASGAAMGLAACGGNSSSVAGAGSTGSNENITVTVMRSKAPTEVAMEQMEVFKIMGEKFNITFEFNNPPQDTYAESLNLVMLEDTLPDVIVEIPTTDVLKYGEAGVILPLNDLIDEKMPNLAAEIDKRDGVRKALTYADGNIYYFPMLDEKVSGNMPYIVRTDWLNKLGMASPVTIEDWEAYWKGIKEDPEINPDGKVLPFSCFAIDYLRNFCTAWGVLDTFYTDPDDGGKVKFGPIEDKYKEALIWMNKMWKAGYIDQEIITADYSSFSSKLAQNIVGSFAGPLGGMLAAQNATMPAAVEGFRVDATVPPVGPEGKYIHSNIDQEPRAVVGAAITATCKNVDRVVEWLDYMYSEEGTLLLNMGVEGTHYNMVDGEPIFTDLIMNNPDGLSPKQGVGLFTITQGSGPFILSVDQVSQLDDESVNKAKNECIIPFLEESKKYILPGGLAFSTEDDAVRREAMTNIESYVDEMVLKFIRGNEPFENWDSYVAEIEKMGIQDVLEIYQNTLDAWNA